MGKRNWFIKFACLSLMVLSTAQAAYLIDNVTKATSGSTYFTALNGTYGFRFQVGPNDLQLTALGIWDRDDDNFPWLDAAVGLWSDNDPYEDNGTLLASDNINLTTSPGYLEGPTITISNAGSNGNGYGRYRYRDLATPITLLAGTYYRVGGVNKNNNTPPQWTYPGFANKFWYYCTPTYSSDFTTIQHGLFWGTGNNDPNKNTLMQPDQFDPLDGSWPTHNVVNMKYRLNPGSVQGIIIGDGFSGDNTTISLKFQFDGVNNDFTRNVTLSADGTFVVSQVPVDTYTIVIKGGDFLSTRLDGVPVGVSQLIDVGAVPLSSGDLDGDNSVTSTDLSVLLEVMP